MYCRTCGNQMNDNAEICVKCGVRKNVGNEYCQNCGAKTLEQAELCTECGVRLLSEKISNGKNLSEVISSEKKAEIISKSKRVIPNILLVLGVLLIIAMLVNTISAFGARSDYYMMKSFSASGRCAIFGGLFTGFGIRLRKKFKKD